MIFHNTCQQPLFDNMNYKKKSTMILTIFRWEWIKFKFKSVSIVRIFFVIGKLTIYLWFCLDLIIANCNLVKHLTTCFVRCILVEISYFAAAPYGNYWVLDTDYENYTLIYSCTSILGISHFEFGWILARTRTLPDATTQKLFGIMENYHINSHHFMKTDQTGC